MGFNYVRTVLNPNGEKKLWLKDGPYKVRLVRPDGYIKAGSRAICLEYNVCRTVIRVEEEEGGEKNGVFSRAVTGFVRLVERGDEASARRRSKGVRRRSFD